MILFRYHELDITLTLKENLENKTIIEFPIFYVVLKDHIDMYEIVDTGEYYTFFVFLYILR